MIGLIFGDTDFPREILKTIKADQEIEKFFKGQKSKKIIFVQNRLINIII